MPDHLGNYTPLSTESGEEPDLKMETIRRTRGSSIRRFALGIIFTVSLTLNIGFTLQSLSTPSTPTSVVFPQLLYSPAQEALSPKVVKFTRGLEDDVPIYERRPSPKVDEAWQDIYFPFMASKVHRSQAELMVNTTYPSIGEKDYYVTSLDVFHQIHCLDMLRMIVHPKHYPDFHLPMNHVRHCIGAIRQSLMCAADISTIAYQWSEKDQSAKQRDDILHSCRDFEKIQEWAKENSGDVEQDFDVYIESDLKLKAL